ncbi:FAD-dependent oxidoreductase [Fodinibacter luteus]|uniref:FAD-dependent oxidoreductase n=1 Tax=Fodinibacter luteus TaxID=552064 RepID=A0ABP8KKL2_9MICO
MSQVPGRPPAPDVAAPSELPERARVVVVGGGVVGASTAYHFAHLGETDVLLLEQGTLSCGTTWHAAGLVGLLRASESGTRLVQYSAALYERLEAETGLATGYRQCGGLIVARTHDRMTALRRTAATAAAYDLDCELLSSEQAGARYPLLRTEDLVGAIWLPGDGTANPTDVTQSLAKGARQLGVMVRERVRVTGFDVVADPAAPGGRRVRGVRTDRGDVACEVVVNCAGQWAKAIGAMAGVAVPLHSAEHFYVVTDQVDGVAAGLPILRDPDGWTYVKEEVGGLVVGGFEPEAKPWVSPEDIPYPFEFQLLDEDWEHFSVLMTSAIHRLPVLERTGIRTFYNGPESFTPDNQFVLGESPDVAGFFVGAGFNSVGIASAGGAGRALAEWVVSGEPQEDLALVDIRRFAPFHASTPWLRARVSEVLGLHYAVPWPNRELDSARPFRCSPVHDRLAAAGAWFGSRMGWERPNYVAPAPVGPQDRPATYGWGRQRWHDWVDEEQRATREAVALFDQTSFGKLRVHGPDALALLHLVCTADVDRPLGSAVYTGVLNRRGGYEADVTVTRVAEEEWLLVTSSASPVRDADWLRRHVAPAQRVGIEDVTTAYAVFGLMGPHSRELLGRLTNADLSPDAFPFATSRVLDLGPARVRATRMTYVGELGWELLVPTELAANVWDRVVAAGPDLGLRLAGYYAINALRLDKGYRAFGAELGPDRTPVEAGLTFTCDLAGERGFVGREAVERQRAEGPRRRLASLVVEDPTAVLWGGELLLRDGTPVGQVTSAAPSATLGASVGLAWVWEPGGGAVPREALTAGGYAVDVAGAVHPVRLSSRAPHDPGNSHVRS